MITLLILTGTFHSRPLVCLGTLIISFPFASCVVLCHRDCGALGGDVVCSKEKTADTRRFKFVGCDGVFSDLVRCATDGDGALVF